MNRMEFLKRAEEYAADRGCDDFFKKYYENFRHVYGVRTSVYRALCCAFDETTANFIKAQS